MKKIPLTQNKYAQVDNEDYGYIDQFKWRISNNGYAMTSVFLKKSNNKRIYKNIYMHRLINKTLPDFYTDHVNGNKTDNRKVNLRTCTSSQNQGNRKNNTNSFSKYKGVWRDKSRNKWCAMIQINHKRKNLGRFVDEKLAAKAYNEAAKQLHGVFSKLNEV